VTYDGLVQGRFGVNLAPTEGQPFSGEVGWFTTKVQGAQPSDFKATVDWGDKTAPSTNVPVLPRTGGGFSVVGTHTYDVTDGYPVTVTIESSNPAFPPDTAATISGSPWSWGPSSPSPAGSRPRPRSRGSPSPPSSPPSPTRTRGPRRPTTRRPRLGATGTSRPAGWRRTDRTSTGHRRTRYETKGGYPVTVTVADNKGSRATETSTVSVDNAPIDLTSISIAPFDPYAKYYVVLPHGGPMPDQPSRYVPFQGWVGWFVTNAFDPSASFTATINWGDNSTSAGRVHASDTISKTATYDWLYGRGPQVDYGLTKFAIWGDHTYFVDPDDSPVTFNTKITVQEAGGGDPVISKNTATVSIPIAAVRADTPPPPQLAVTVAGTRPQRTPPST